MYYQDKLVYSSSDSLTFHTRLYKWNEQPYLDMFIGEMNEIESDVNLLEEFSKDLNTKYHEATLAFSPDEKKVYFTRNNYIKELERDEEERTDAEIPEVDREENESLEVDMMDAAKSEVLREELDIVLSTEATGLE